MRILLVEHDEDNGPVLKSIMTSYGHKVKLIPTAREALEDLKINRYDIIFLDHFTCLCEKLCDAFKNSDSKIIIITSIKGFEKDFDGLKIHNILKKPFNLDELENCLNKRL